LAPIEKSLEKQYLAIVEDPIDEAAHKENRLWKKRLRYQWMLRILKHHIIPFCV